MEEIAVFLGSLFALLFTGMPIAIALMLCCLVLIWYTDIGDAAYQLSFQLVSGSDNYILITVPFFILAGEIMKEGGISSQLIKFAQAVVGRFRGGLGYAAILSCMLFAGLSGVAIADVAALGGILVPMMSAVGYDKGRSTGLVCASALTAPIIPPSLPMIILGVTVGLSIGRLFVMGIGPGIMLGLSIMVAWFIVVRRDGYKDVTKVPVRELPMIFAKAFPSLMLPVIIIVGIRMGYFTPTEGGAVACAYAFIVAFFINRALKLSKLPDILFEACKSTAVVMFIVGGACAIGWIITMADVPASLVELLSGLEEHPGLLLVILNIFLLCIGMVMDITPVTLIFAPVIFPLVQAAGIDVYYFAIIMILNLCIGLLTPPVGTVLFVGCSVSKLPMDKIVKGTLPFLIAELLFLGTCLLFPDLIMAPASWLGAGSS
jgi:tripartite ATP-independent transporter DctM subunit